MKKPAKKKAKRVRDRIYRIAFLGKDGTYREPDRKFETYRRVLLNGQKKREAQCFATIEEAERFRDSGNVDVTPKPRGMLLGEVVEAWKLAHFPHIQPTTREQVLKVFPSRSERELDAANRSRKGLPPRELPLDFLLKLEAGSIGPVEIDAWLAHVKGPAFLAGMKSTRTSFKNEYVLLAQVLNYYASRIDRTYRLPFLKDHRKKLKVRDPKPRAEKDLPAEKLPEFLRALEEYCAGGPYEYVLPRMAEAEYLAYARVSEAAAIHLEDLNPTSNVVTLTKSVQYLKRGEQRAVLREGHKANGGRFVRSAELTRLLLEVAMKRGIRSGPLFFVDGRPIPYKAIQNAYDAAHRAAGTGQTGTHVLRHGALSEFQEASKDLKQTMKVAGHADVKSTVRYAKARDSAVSESQERVEAKLRAVRPVR